MESIRFDAVRLKAQITQEGYLRDSPIIGRAGIQEYRRADGTLRREYRPPEVVFAAESLAAVQGIPIIDQHIGLMNATNVRQHVIGTVLTPARQDGTNFLADIVIYDSTPVTKHGRKELSLAYAVRTDETPGQTPEGENYDAKIEAILRYDHLAIVEKGRAGVARLRLDSDDAISTELPDPADIPQAPEDIKVADTPQNTPTKLVVVRVDGIEYQTVPEVERALTRLNTDLTAAQRRADEAEAARDSLQAKIANHEAELAQVRSDAAGTVRARLELEGVAKQHGVDVRVDASDRSIREAVIRKLNNSDMKFDDKRDDYVLFAFDHAVAEAAKVKKTTEVNRAVVNGAAPQATVRADAVSPAGRIQIRSAAEAQRLANSLVRRI